MAIPEKRYAAPPANFESVGVGGGGALFAPSISPHDTSDMFVACDMSEVFHTTTFGALWAPVHFTEIVGNRSSQVQYTSSASTLYCINHDEELPTPCKSLDGGVTWAALTGDPTDRDCWWMSADPDSTQRLLVSDYNAVYFSSNGGASFAQRFTIPGGNGCYVGGAVWNGSTIYIGTSGGLYVSVDNGATFTTSGVPQISGRGIVSLAGATQSGITRLFAVTAPTGDLYPGILHEIDLTPMGSTLEIYSLDWGAVSWVARQSGIATEDGIILLGMARNDISICYAAGGSSDEDWPALYKTTNAGVTWTSVLDTEDNGNFVTGWAGDGGDRGYGYGGGIVGLSVAPTDANRAAFSDYGFVHTTSDGGTTWRQAYVDQGYENAAGFNTPAGKSYKTSGLENTSAWRLTWLDENNLWAGFSDIRGIRSVDGGDSWSFNYSGHTFNTSYDCLKHPSNGMIYLATSSAHDIYQTTYLTDARLDGANGQILMSSNNGQSWSLLHNFGDPVIDIALHPTDDNRMYASVIHSTNGGIYRTTNLQLGASSTWTRLAVPVRTEGHAFNIHVLNDGTLVATYSARRTSTAFTASSGVFVSTDDGTNWTDVSHANMQYYTKDLVIDPHDATQNTWYACVWTGYGNPNIPANRSSGGLYRTTNRGGSWTRINSLYRVSSCTIDPLNPEEMYLTTEQEGLWHTSDLSSETPTFTQVESYPFRQPERVFFNPHDQEEVWITSFGHGLRRGNTADVPAGISLWEVY